MLDFDLAGLYGIGTKVLKQAVRRNIKRFEGDDFTELGVSMLSSVLNSDIAIDANRKIMRAFVAIRQLILNPPIDEVTELQKEVKALKQHIEDVFSDYNDINEDTRIQIELINQSLAELQMQKRVADKPRNPIGYTAPQYRSKTED